MDTFGESDRLSPDEARKFIDRLISAMQTRAWNLAADSEDINHPREDDDPSVAKQIYGDTWTFIYGIYEGKSKMRSGSTRVWEDGRPDGWQVDDSEWQEHYEQYGYGVYGRGLEIGKKLAFYQETDFEFSDGEEDRASEFEFTNYNE